MHRIDTKTAQKDKFGAGKNGFTRGNPQTGTPATDLDDDYFDMLQEELCSVVEASGASLEKGRHDQLLTALRALLLSRKNPFSDIKSDGTVKTALENLNIDRIKQLEGETVIFSDNNKDKYLTSRSDNSWGYYNSTLNRFIPLPLSSGGTGVTSIGELKNSLGLKSGAYGEVRTGAVAGTGNKTFSTPFPQGVVSGIAFCPVTSTGYMYSASVGFVNGSGFSFKPVYFSGGGNPIQAA
ncbi:TPA: carbohydrate kinase, partial [Escherichia coli]